ncbi:MAG: V-type ATP synthase subunit E [Desulfurococcales archaeon]|nr:V-type ATP synthase subunit E [Desulfurococcales archaeon]
MRIYGDPEALARAIVEREEKNAQSVIDESYQAALKIIEDAYKRALADALRKIEDEYQRLVEALTSKRSSLELELRNRVAEVKSKYIDEAISKAVDAVVASKNEEWYPRFMRRVLERIAEEARRHDRVIVKVAKDDLELARGILQTLHARNIILSPEPAPIKGGAIAESEDGSIRIDYSLDLILSLNEAKLRLAASRALFRET